MKLKFSPALILSIILAEIILIEVFLIFVFFKNNSSNGTSSKELLVSQENTLVKIESTGKGKDTGKSSTSKNKELPEVKETGTQTNKDSSDKEASEAGKEFRLEDDLLYKMFLEITGPYVEDGDLKITDRKIEDGIFTATAYDLSYASCGKYPSNPAYGITFSGRRAIKGRTIAVDPDVIPLGSNVYIEFKDEYKFLNGWYKAEDTGSKVKGKIIDIFMGESAFYEMEKFGSRKVYAEIEYPK